MRDQSCAFLSVKIDLQKYIFTFSNPFFALLNIFAIIQSKVMGRTRFNKEKNYHSKFQVLKFTEKTLQCFLFFFIDILGNFECHLLSFLNVLSMHHTYTGSAISFGPAIKASFSQVCCSKQQDNLC